MTLDGKTFRVVYQTKHGDTVQSDDPKLDAYKQAHHLKNILGRKYELIAHEDGSYTVKSPGLASITFMKEVDDAAQEPGETSG